jgi:hypothetical protein
VIPLSIFLAEARSLSDIDLSTATNDAPASVVVLGEEKSSTCRLKFSQSLF